MLYTTNYNLSKAEGTDTVNLLTQNYPNFDIIDTAMKANADAGITVATETKTGTNHAIVRTNTGAAVFRFTATSNYAAGDTFTVDTTVVTAVLPSGQSLPAGAFVINSTVLAILVGTQLTILASVGSTDAETLEGHTASYFATASDLQEVADDAADALEDATAALDGITWKDAGTASGTSALALPETFKELSIYVCHNNDYRTYEFLVAKPILDAGRYRFTTGFYNNASGNGSCTVEFTTSTVHIVNVFEVGTDKANLYSLKVFYR